MEVAHFTECAGLKSNTEIYTIKEGGMNHAVHKLPGQSTWDNIVLKYGVTSDMSMLGLREFIMNDEYAGGSDAVDLGDVMNAGSTNTSAGSLINSLSNSIRSALDGGASSGKMENKRFSGSIVLEEQQDARDGTIYVSAGLGSVLGGTKTQLRRGPNWRLKPSRLHITESMFPVRMQPRIRLDDRVRKVYCNQRTRGQVSMREGSALLERLEKKV